MNKSYQIDQLKSLYRDYGKTVQEMTEQNFPRGQSVVADLMLEMTEIEQTLTGLQEFDDRLERVKAKAQKNYDYYLSKANDFE